MKGYKNDEELYSELDSNLFTSNKPKKGGIRTCLNTDYIWGLFWYIKKFRLTKIERACVSDYRLQNYLIILSQYKSIPQSLDKLLDLILFELRSHCYYWMKDSDVYLKIEEVLKKNVESDFKNNLAKEEKIEEEKNNIEIKIEKEKIQEPIKKFQREVIPEEKKVLVKMTPYLAFENFNKAQAISRKYLDFELTPLANDYFKKLEKTQNLLEKRINPKDKEQITQVITSFLQNQKSKSGVISGEQRYTRNMKREQKSENGMQLKFNLNYNLEALEEKFKLDMGHCKKINYERSIIFNPKYSIYKKVPLNIIKLTNNFLVKILFPKYNSLKNKENYDLTGIEQFLFMFQNFMLFLNFSNYPIEVFGGRNKFSKKKEDKFNFVKLLEKENIKTDRLLLRFQNYCYKKKIELNFTSIEAARIKQIIFVKNLLILGTRYFKFYKEKKKKPKIRKTFSNINEALQKNNEKRNFNKKLPKIIAHLENLETLTCYQSTKLAEYYIYNYDSKLNKNLKVKEQLLTYANKIQEKRDKTIKIYKVKESETAINNYLKYLNDPERKKKTWYKFHSEDKFCWSKSNYKKFIEGYLKFSHLTVNNLKIAQFVGEGVSANHIKFLKTRFQKEAKKRAKANRLKLKDQILKDLQNFQFEVSFPWLNKDNLIN